MPELAWMDGVVQGGLWEPLEDWLELCSEGSKEVVRRHPFLSSMSIANRGEGKLV